MISTLKSKFTKINPEDNANLSWVFLLTLTIGGLVVAQFCGFTLYFLIDKEKSGVVYSFLKVLTGCMTAVGIIIFIDGMFFEIPKKIIAWLKTERAKGPVLSHGGELLKRLNANSDDPRVVADKFAQEKGVGITRVLLPGDPRFGTMETFSVFMGEENYVFKKIRGKWVPDKY